MRGILHSFFIRRTTSLFIGLLVVGSVFFVNAKSAHADPHAMFYTVVGQQQLFFNVLAALDQADYVEPASVRDQLLVARQQAGFSPESDPRATSTATQLSGLLTRPITLEGNDLWTSYLLHQYAVETFRTNATDELYRVFCEQGLGRIGCSEDARAQQQQEVFNLDPIERAEAPYRGAVAAFDSGSEYDQKKRDELIDPKSDARQEPRPYDASIARLRQENNEDYDQILNRLSSHVSTVGNETVNPKFLQAVDIDNGEPALKDGQDYSISDITGIATSFLQLPTQAGAVANRASNQVRQYQDAESPRGDVLADARPIQQSKNGKNITSKLAITNPAQSREALIEGIPELLAQSNASQYYTPSDGPSLGQESARELLNQDGGGSSAGGDQGDGSVAGAQDVPLTRGSGEVAGIFDILSGLYQIYDFYDEPIESGDPGTAIKTREQGEIAALRAITGNNFRTGDPDVNEEDCGFCSDLDGYLNSFVEFASEALCLLFGICSE